MVVPIDTFKTKINPNVKVTVNKSLNLTISRGTQNNLIQNPVHENTKTLNPVQQINIIGKGTDPSVIVKVPNTNAYVIRTQKTNNINTNPNNPETVLGPLIQGLKGENLNNLSNQVLQITNGLTLPEIFQLIGLDVNEYVPHNYNNTNNGFVTSYVGDSANVSFSGNSIIFNREYVSEVMSKYGTTINRRIRNIEIEPYTTTINGQTYNLVLVKVDYNIYNESPYYVSNNTYTHYYIIDPTTKQIVYQGTKVKPILNMPLNQSSTNGYIISPSKTINNILQQYGYNLTSQEMQEIENLQPGQSIKIGNSTQTPIIITYLGNNQYNIKSLGEFYTPDGQEIAINETLTIPTYSISANGEISTTNLQISGTEYLIGSGKGNPFYVATYKVNETIPTNYMYNTQTGQLTFWSGNTQGGATLQSINLPTLTYQQYIQLANGQIPPGIKPGWYYYPTLNEFVYVNTQTIQSSSSNQYSYIFYNPNVPYSTTNSNVAQYIAVNTNTDTISFLNSQGQVLNSISFANIQALDNYLYKNYGITLTNNGPTITTSTSTQTTTPTITTNQSSTSTTSLSIPTIINDIWNGLTTIGSDVYSWFTSLSKPKNNTLQLNYQQLAQEVLYSQTSTSTKTSHSTTTTTNQPQILQYSFFSPQLLSDIWNGITTVGNDVYNWFSSLSKKQISIITNIGNNAYNLFTNDLFNNPIFKGTYDIGKNIFYDTYNVEKNILDISKKGLSSINWKQQLDLANKLQTFGFLLGINSPYAEYIAQDLYLNAIGAKGKYVNQLNTLSNYIVQASDIVETMFGTMGVGDIIGAGAGAAEVGTEAMTESSELLASGSRLYTTVANMGRLSSSFDTITTGTTQMFKAINPEFVGVENEVLANIRNIGASQNFGLTLIRNVVNDITSNPTGYLKEVGIWTGINWATTNIEDWLSGKPVTSLKGQLEILGESAAQSVAFVSLSKMFESIANPILNSWIKPTDSLNWAIRKRLLYDVGANFIAGMGSSYVGQGVGVLMGLQNGISNTEALLSGVFASGGTLLAESIMGLRALKTGNFFNFATDTVPRNVKITDVSLNVIGDDMATSLYRASGLADYYPRIGGKVVTEKDISNLKLKEGSFQTIGKIKMDNNIDTINIDNLNIPTYRYAGYLVSTSGKNKVYGITEGLFFGFRKPIQSDNPFLYYLEKIQNVRNYLIEKHPEFKEISNTPETGLYLFRTLTGGTYEQTIKNINEDKTLLEAGSAAYFNKLEKDIYDQTILNTQNEIKELQFSENEAKQAMEIANQYYKDALETLNKYKTNIQNILKNDVKNLANNPEYLKLTNLEGLGNYIPPERFNIKPGKLPNPEGLNKGILYIEKPLSEFKINNVDFGKNIAGEFEFRAFSRSIFSTGNMYKSSYYGFGLEYIGEDNTLSHIGTMFGIEKDLYGKGWYTIKQYGAKKLSDNVYLTFGYGESWDPTIKSMSLPSLKSANGQPLSIEEVQPLLKETIKPPVPPANNAKPPLYNTMSGISANINNIYNIYNNMNMNQPPYNNNNQKSNIKSKVKPTFNNIINGRNINIIKQPTINMYQPTGLNNPMNQLNINTNIFKVMYLPAINLFNMRITETQTSTTTITTPITTTTYKQILTPMPSPPISNPPITDFAPSIILGLQPGKASASALNRNVKVTYDLYYALNRLI